MKTFVSQAKNSADFALSLVKVAPSVLQKTKSFIENSWSIKQLYLMIGEVSAMVISKDPGSECIQPVFRAVVAQLKEHEALESRKSAKSDDNLKQVLDLITEICQRAKPHKDLCKSLFEEIDSSNLVSLLFDDCLFGHHS